ncbi:MAG: hypothetical protein K8S21_04645 [Gemmatimonadetes bacterium]|nr:hypothetical protein [Gemmatimonadota bacterium]
MTRPIQFLKRWTLLLHHYLGAALSLLCAMWFITGIVLMYAPFPEFRAERRFLRMEPLDCATCAGGLADALAAMPERDTTADPRLGMLLGRPVWRFRGTDRRTHLVRAEDPALLDSVSALDALRLATRYAGFDEDSPGAARRLDAPDQWTVEGNIREQLPLYRVDFADAGATRVYVSVVGGEAIAMSTRRERTLAWIGAIPHWLYPRLLRVRLSAWTGTVIVLSGLGILLSLSGLAIGLWQFRLRRRVRAGSSPLARSPYRPAWLRWHHYLGLLFGVVTFTWFLSGMLSIDPFDWSPGDSPTPVERLRFAGRAWEPARNSTPTEVLARVPGDVLVPRELRPITVGGVAYWAITDSLARTTTVADAPLAGGPTDTLPSAVLSAAIRSLVAERAIARVDTLRAHDDYYRDARPLPVVRVALADRDGTAYYIDPHVGAIAMKQVRRSRWERWLYTGLHDFDFAWLRSRRPLWDVVVIVLSLGGLALAVSGVVVGWRWWAPRFGLRVEARR